MKNKKIILFQGDSITDACRERERNVYLGSGYPNFIAGILECKYPYEYEYINRGVSGNRITDMYARINKDAIKLSPDYLSILIGINDVWHEVDVQDGVDNEKFEKVRSSANRSYGLIFLDLSVSNGSPITLISSPSSWYGS